MRRLYRLAFSLGLAGLLAACQLSPAGKGTATVGDGLTPNAVSGGTIEVTALDAMPGDAAPSTPATEAAGSKTAVPQAAPPAPDTGAEAEAPEAVAEPAPKADPEATPVTPKSEMQIACEKKKGKWSRIGKGDARACVFRTRDGGKRCEKESQCEGLCLARSGTCSPIKPMYGCNEILQDDGARVTLCLE
jgi:hypothetical protein